MKSTVKKHKGPGAIVLVVVLLLAVAGSAAWVIHTILEGNDPVTVITESVTNVIPAGVVPGIKPNPPLPKLPPSQLAEGQRAPGAVGSPGGADMPPVVVPPMAGGQVASGEEDAAPGGDTPPPDVLMVPGALGSAPVASREDAVVRPSFISDLAAFLAQNYWPAGTHPAAARAGASTVSLRWANLRYGAELQGLDRGSDPALARTAVLRYVLSPAVIERIYGLYADSFVQALHAAADRRVIDADGKERHLTAQEKREMLTIYANFASFVAAALERYAAESAMPGHVAALAEAEREVQEAHRAYMESVLLHEEAAGNAKGTLTAARLRMDKDAATYQKRLRERETARETLVAAMSRDKNPRSSSADTLTYVAFWSYRRGEGSGPALRACARTLTEMSAKLTAAARQTQ